MLFNRIKWCLKISVILNDINNVISVKSIQHVVILKSSPVVLLKYYPSFSLQSAIHPAPISFQNKIVNVY